MESPRNIEGRPAGRPDTPSRAVATRVTNNSIQLVPLCQTDLIRLLCGDSTRIVASRIVREGQKKERYLDLLSQHHHLGRLQQRPTTLSPIFRRISEAASAEMIDVRRSAPTEIVTWATSHRPQALEFAQPTGYSH